MYFIKVIDFDEKSSKNIKKRTKNTVFCSKMSKNCKF